MLNFYVEQFILFIASLITNTLSALAGGGSGLLQLPLLLFLGLVFSTALATHKIASVALGVGATIRHLRENSLEKPLIVFILACGLPGVLVGTQVILKVDDSLAKLALGFLTLSLGIYSSFQRNMGHTMAPIHRTPKGFIIGGTVLFLIGLLNGSLTSGTGLFVMLWLVRWFGFDYKTAVAYTLILVGLFWNGLGAFALSLQASVQWSWLPALLLGSFFGGYLGAHLSIVKGNRFIKLSFELLTLAVGAKLIWDGISQ